MSEEEKIEQSADDGPQPAYRTGRSTENENISELQTTNYQPQIENMEVHKHPHHVTHKKKWGEYFLEFLMIFLAVTLGFFAESLREHMGNNEKREQYIQSLTENLEADTARMDDIIMFDEDKIVSLNTMYQCYDSVSNDLKATACMGLLVKYSKVNRPFQQNDRTIMQLANAGGYSLLKKEDADSILDYERLYKANHDFETTIYQEAQNNVRNTLSELADFKVIAPLQNASTTTGNQTGSSSVNGPLLFSGDRALLNKWFNQLQLYLRVTKAQNFQLHQLKDKAVNLITFYKDKHHLK